MKPYEFETLKGFECGAKEFYEQIADCMMKGEVIVTGKMKYLSQIMLSALDEDGGCKLNLWRDGKKFFLIGRPEVIFKIPEGDISLEGGYLVVAGKCDCGCPDCQGLGVEMHKMDGHMQPDSFVTGFVAGLCGILGPDDRMVEVYRELCIGVLCDGAGPRE